MHLIKIASYFFDSSSEISLFFRLSRISTAYLLVFASYLRKSGIKIAKIATTTTQITPPEVTEKERLVAAATDAARH